MIRMLWQAVACAAVLLHTSAWCQDDDQQADDDRGGHVLRHTSFGPVVGIDDSARSGTLAWKGVPFAQPPVGSLRWRPPVDPVSWKAPLRTQQFGNACVQYGR